MERQYSKGSIIGNYQLTGQNLSNSNFIGQQINPTSDDKIGRYFVIKKLNVPKDKMSSVKKMIDATKNIMDINVIPIFERIVAVHFLNYFIYNPTDKNEPFCLLDAT